jgi:hypothetical protein
MIFETENITRRKFIKFAGIFPLFLMNLDKIPRVFSSIDLFDDDEKLFIEKIKYFLQSDISSSPVGQIIRFVGNSFLGISYVANTLEINDIEQLVINLRGFDCVTFVENCLSFSRCLKKNITSFSDFKNEIENIRYRDGKIDGYASRLNYFCDWIYNNEQKGIVKDITQDIGGVVYDKNINFMSKHVKSYKQLADKTELEGIKACEDAINSRDHYYIPKKSISKAYDNLQMGDIIATTTTIEGLDVTHTGYVYKADDGGTYFMHASSKYGEVIISKNQLADFISEDSKKTGIMVARPREV